MTDLATMLKQQMQNTLTAQLDSAVQAGDIAAARKAAQAVSELAVASVPRTSGKSVPTTDAIKAALMAKADWFGVDPRKSAKAVELGKMMDPSRFETAEAFADSLLKEIEKDEKAAGKDDDNEDGEDDENQDGEDGESEDAEAEAAAEKRREARRNDKRRDGTAGRELNVGGRSAPGNSLRQAFETGDIKHLPRSVADEIKKTADKFARNATKEQKAAFIKNAVTARARADLISSGKYDAKSGKFK